MREVSYFTPLELRDHVRAVAVVGYKGSGKTTAVEAIVKGLVRRGYKVVTLKHVHSSFTMHDVDTARHLEAGASLTIALSPNLLVRYEKCSCDVYSHVYEVLLSLQDYDFAVLEGFKKFWGARVVAAKSLEEALELKSPLNIAYTGLLSTEGDELENLLGAPLIDAVREPEKLVSIVVERSFKPPAGLNCGRCRWGSCRALAIAVAKGNAGDEECINSCRGVVLKVDGNLVRVNKFVARIFDNVIGGLVDALKGVPREYRRVELLLSRAIESQCT